jgi:hypothetical protein
MSDPDYVHEMPPPPPPRKTPRQQAVPTAGMSQVDADALYARQLAAQYGDSSYSGFGSRGEGDPPLRSSSRRETGLKPNEMYRDKEHSFMDGESRQCVVFSAQSG